MNSPTLKLNKKDLTKVGTGAAIAGGGAAVVYILQALPMIDFGQYTVAVAAFASVALNLVRKWISDNK